MTHISHIEIPISRTKVAGLILCCLVFVLIGVWFIVDPPRISHPVIGDPLTLKLAGISSFVFFGAGGFIITRRLFDPTPGVVISKDGILNNTTIAGKQFIPWKDIAGITWSQVQRTKFINIHVIDSEEYIAAEKRTFVRWLMKQNVKKYKSVATISSNGLNCNFDDLENMLRSAFEKYQSGKK